MVGRKNVSFDALISYILYSTLHITSHLWQLLPSQLTVFLCGAAGVSEDSDYTSDIGYPIGQNPNSSASQYLGAASSLSAGPHHLTAGYGNGAYPGHPEMSPGAGWPEEELYYNSRPNGRAVIRYGMTLLVPAGAMDDPRGLVGYEPVVTCTAMKTFSYSFRSFERIRERKSNFLTLLL